MFDLTSYKKYVHYEEVGGSIPYYANLVTRPQQLEQLSNSSSAFDLAMARIPYLAAYGRDLTPNAYLSLKQLELATTYDDVSYVRRIVDNVTPSLASKSHIEHMTTLIGTADEEKRLKFAVIVAYLLVKIEAQFRDGHYRSVRYLTYKYLKDAMSKLITKLYDTTVAHGGAVSKQVTEALNGTLSPIYIKANRRVILKELLEWIPDGFSSVVIPTMDRVLQQ